MRIFTITSVHHFASDYKLLLTKTIIKTAVHVVSNHAVISCSMLICFYHKITAKFNRIFFVFYSINDSCIITNVSYDYHTVEIFCSGANHGRSADVNIFYDIFKIISFFNSLFKRIKIYTNQVYRFNTQLFCLV